MNDNLHYIESVDSTNKYLSKLSEQTYLPDGYTIVAVEQYAGKGQGTNKWESEKGKNLTFSTIFHPSFLKASEQFWFSKTMALGIYDFASQYANNISIKWPNDIYADSRKLSGTLIECVLNGSSIKQAIIGVGININQKVFISDAPNPVSLTQLSGKTYNLNLLLEELVSHLMNRYEELKTMNTENIDTEHHKHLYLLNQKSWFKDASGLYCGIIRQVVPKGGLIIEKEDKTLVQYGFKEVEFVK